MGFLFRAFSISLLFVDADAGYEFEDEDALLLLEDAIITSQNGSRDRERA